MTIYIKGSGNPLTHAQMDENMKQLQLAIDNISTIQDQLVSLSNAANAPVSQQDIDLAIQSLMLSLNDNYATKTALNDISLGLAQNKAAIQALVNGQIAATESAKAQAEDLLAQLLLQQSNINFGDANFDALAAIFYSALIASAQAAIANYESQLQTLSTVLTDIGTWHC